MHVWLIEILKLVYTGWNKEASTLTERGPLVFTELLVLISGVERRCRCTHRFINKDHECFVRDALTNWIVLQCSVCCSCEWFPVRPSTELHKINLSVTLTGSDTSTVTPLKTASQNTLRITPSPRRDPTQCWSNQSRFPSERKPGELFTCPVITLYF